MSQDAALVGAAATQLRGAASRGHEVAGVLRARGEDAAAGWEGTAERAFVGRVGAVAGGLTRLAAVLADAADALHVAEGQLAAVEGDERSARALAGLEGLRVAGTSVLPYVADPDPVQAARQAEAASDVRRRLGRAQDERRQAHARLAARLRAAAASVPGPLPGAPGFLGPVAPAPDFWVPPPPTFVDRALDLSLGTEASLLRDGAASVPSTLATTARHQAAFAARAGQEARDVRPNRINGLFNQAGRARYKELMRDVRALRGDAARATVTAGRVPAALQLIDDAPRLLAQPAEGAPGVMARGVRLAGRLPGLPALSAGIGMYADVRDGESLAQAGTSQGAALVTGTVAGTATVGVLVVLGAPFLVTAGGAVLVGAGVGFVANKAVDWLWDRFDDEDDDEDDDEEHR